MDEKELDKKNKRTILMKTGLWWVLKFTYLLVILTYTIMGLWNKVIVMNLGVGRENWNPTIFLPISLFWFSVLSVSSGYRYWLTLIDTWRYSVYIIVINLMVWLIQ